VLRLVQREALCALDAFFLTATEGNAPAVEAQLLAEELDRLRLFCVSFAEAIRESYPRKNHGDDQAKFEQHLHDLAQECMKALWAFLEVQEKIDAVRRMALAEV
jgi:hypothetical protein